MPILWRYLLSQYMRVMLLSLVAFIGILLATRLDDIAKFAAFGGSGSLVWRFAALQVPYIFPIALPICCALAATLLFQRLSSSGELTSMRATGWSFAQVCMPILLAAAMLSVSNFYIVSEVATRSHLKVRQLQNEAKTINPMALLQKRALLQRKGAYVDVLGSFRAGEHAEDVVFAVKNRNSGRVHILLADQLHRQSEEVLGTNVTILSSVATPEPESFDHMIIENMNEVGTPISEFGHLIRKEGWSLSDDHLQMGMLLVRLRELFGALAVAKKAVVIDDKELRDLRKERNEAVSELFRRISVAVAVLTFTLMGCAYGTSISRLVSAGRIPVIVGLACLYLIGFFLAKEFESQILMSIPLYFVPHVIIVMLSFRQFKRVGMGVE